MTEPDRDPTHRDPTQRKAGRLPALLLLLLLLGGGLRLLHLGLHLSSPLGKVEEVFLSSDLHAFSEWGKRIAAGDLLGRDTYHPYMDWMKPIAPLETFESWWGGKEIYHQAPLYAYLAGASYALAGSLLPLFLLQILLSTLAVGLLYGTGRILAGRAAGLWAAGIWAFFAPAVVLDALLLRASLISTWTILSVYLLLRLARTPRPGRALAAGVVLGLGILLKPTWILFALLALPALLAARPGAPRKWLPLLAAGVLLPLLPLWARNLAVGAPLFSLSTRGPETALQNNNRHSDPALFAPPPPEKYRKWMEEAKDSTLAALRVGWRTWPAPGRTGWFLWHLGRKVQACLRDMEYPNNIDFYAYRRATPVLAFLPTFGWFSGAALLGLLFLLLPFRRGEGKERRAWLLPAAAFLSLLAGVLLAYAAGRYRAPLALLAALPAGYILSRIQGLIRERRLLPAGVALAGAALLSLPSFFWAPTRIFFTPRGRITLAGADARLFEETEALRPQEFVTAARVLRERGERGRALDLLRGYLEELEDFRRAWEGGASPAGRAVLHRGTAQGFRKAAREFRALGEGPEAARLETRAARLEARADRLLQSLLR